MIMSIQNFDFYLRGILVSVMLPVAHHHMVHKLRTDNITLRFSVEIQCCFYLRCFA